jgi:hypothetical protein
MGNPFCIVTGDAGYDLFTFAQENAHRERPGEAPSSRAVRDWYVPSGAPFVHHVLQQSIKDDTICLFSDFTSDEGYKLAALPLVLHEFAGFKRTGARLAHFSELNNKEHRKGRETFRTRFSEALNCKDDVRLLVIHDGGRSWSRNQKLSGQLECFLERLARVPILVNVKELPEVVEPTGASEPYPTFRSSLWRKLTKRPGPVGCVLSLPTLRRAGVGVTQGLSWEQTVEDFATELHLFPRLRALSQFAHLFFRIGTEGLIHIANTYSDAGCRFRGRLYFTPYADAVHRPGHIIGKNTLLISSLAHQILLQRQQALSAKREADIDGKTLLNDKAMRDALRTGMENVIRANRSGYNLKVALQKNEAGDWSLIDELIKPKPQAISGSDDQAVSGNPEEELSVVSIEIPNLVLAEPVPHQVRSAKRWHILDETLEHAPVHRINIAVAIVRAGLKNVINKRWDLEASALNQDLWKILTRVEYWNPQDLAPDFVTLQDGYPPAMPVKSHKDLPIIKGAHEEGFNLTVPVEEFGALVVAEREQIEDLCSIRNLLRVYVEDKTRHDKPISIAVFASPGAGKSFAVKEIAKKLGSRILEYNVAQFRTADDLARALHQVEQEGKKEPPPLAFFDEFDCTFADAKLGWLKYFLAPMQDGKFYSGNLDMSIEIGRAIFVFAGGVFDRFEKFDPRGTLPDERLGHVFSEAFKKRGEDFKEAKGPDFVSRLRGYIDVPSANAEPGRGKHFIRRAIQLRSLLDKLNLIDNGGLAKVEEPVIYALLTVDRYRHEVRSMEAILRMCRPIDDRILASSLPAPAQLDMHVDAKKFFIRLHRGRARMEDSISSGVEDMLKRLDGASQALSAEVRSAIVTLAKQMRDGASLTALLQLEQQLSANANGGGGLDSPN